MAPIASTETLTSQDEFGALVQKDAEFLVAVYGRLLKRRSTSSQFTLRMNASTYLAAALP